MAMQTDMQIAKMICMLGDSGKKPQRLRRAERNVHNHTLGGGVPKTWARDTFSTMSPLVDHSSFTFLCFFFAPHD